MKSPKTFMTEATPTISMPFDLDAALHNAEQLIEASEMDSADQFLTGLSPANHLILLSRLPREQRRRLFEGLTAEKVADYLHDIHAAFHSLGDGRGRRRRCSGTD